MQEKYTLETVASRKRLATGNVILLEGKFVVLINVEIEKNTITYTDYEYDSKTIYSAIIPKRCRRLLNPVPKPHIKRYILKE